MNTPIKLGAYALGLVVVFGGTFAVGGLVGPQGTTAKAPGAHATHGGTEQAARTASVPGGLQVSQDGYTLVPETTTVTPAERADFRFTVTGPDGKPVTRYTKLHGKWLHLIVARRDMSGFQHVHPSLGADGVWSVPLELPDPGVYRFFTDVQPEGVKEQLTLGTDITAPGDYQPEPLPAAAPVATVGDYAVRLEGALTPGRSSRLKLTVEKDGRPVTDIQPYLEAYGHLVALREGDLAYLHVHPDGEPGDGRTRPGPGITFFAEVPSTGTYRLYLDFKHGDKVRTAEFTVRTAGAAAAPEQPSGEASEGAGGGEGHGDHTH
ncbi:MAG: hypothetical protein GEV11_12610 [Streptosporangiales bacterium]|nr:hypothetical protein [Streptosporangiales bacterium]